MTYKMGMARSNKKYLRQVKILMKENGCYLVRNNKHPIFGNDKGDRLTVPFSSSSDADTMMKKLKARIRRQERGCENRF